MSASQELVDRIVKQAAGGGAVSARNMFGGYGLFCDGRMVGIIDDGQLFIRITETGRDLFPEAQEVPPYPGAKPYFLVPNEKWEDGEWLSKLICETAQQTPLPKKRQKRT